MVWRKKYFAYWLMLLAVVLFVGGMVVSNTNRDILVPEDIENSENNEITVIPIRDNLFVIRGAVANVTALIGDEGVLIVDTGIGRLTANIQAAIAELTDKKVAYVINTHSHFDHRNGNAHFRAQGAEIIAQTNTRDNIVGDGYSPTNALDVPTITFENAYFFTFGGQEIRLTHIPNAHTNGDAMVHFVQADVIATGDLFVFRGLPFISYRSGATIDGYLAGQMSLLSHIGENTIVVPGHGPLANRVEFVSTNDKLRVIRDRIAALKAKGVSSRYTRLFFPTRNTWGSWREQKTGIKDKLFVYIVHSTLPNEAAIGGSQ